MKVTLTKTGSDYYVVGDNSHALSKAWNLEVSADYMSETSTGVWELTKNNVALSAGSIQWKVVVNPLLTVWENQYGTNGTGNDQWNCNTAIPVDGVYEVTFKLDLNSSEENKLSATVTKVGEVKTIYVEDNSAWSSTKLYAWSEGNPELFGDWQMTVGYNPVTVNYGTKTYKKFPFVASDKTYNFIFSDNGSADSGKRVEKAGFVADKDYYITLTASEATILESVSISPAKQYTTYVAPAPLNFSTVDGLTAFKASSADASEVTLTEVTEVPAGTPLILKGTGTFSVPVIASADAIGGNLLRAGDGTTNVGGEGVYDYILSDGLFYHVSPAGPVAVGKAYLHLDAAPSSPELNIVFDDEQEDDITAGIEKISDLPVSDSPMYNLNGQRVEKSQLRKGLYIVNGKKVTIK